MENQFLIFDLDGTISDPKMGITRSINYSLKCHGFPEREEQELVKYIGPPLDNTFKELASGSDQALTESLVEKYRERYSEVGYSENTLYGGIVDCLESLAKRYPLAVCTSKRVDFASMILALFKISHLFQVVNGGDIGITKSQQLSELLSKGIVGENSIMIGDRNVDLISARANHLRSIGVLWGYGDYEELHLENPYAILDNPKQLLEVIT